MIEGYQKVADKKELQEGGLLKVEADGEAIVLSMINGRIYAIDAVCSHEGGPLADGTLDGYEIECPWHGSKFDVRTDKQLPLKIIMFDSNRDRDNILFKKEFDDWSNINKNLKIIYTISEDQHGQQSSTTAKNDDWKGEYGRIDKSMILKYVDSNVLNNSIFYICGPPSMLKAMQALLQEDLTIPKERIKVEEFTGY
jgi:nitrite reductase/ring-hydroxylating ferredoxin subunit